MLLKEDFLEVSRDEVITSIKESSIHAVNLSSFQNSVSSNWDTESLLKWLCAERSVVVCAKLFAAKKSSLCDKDLM